MKKLVFALFAIFALFVIAMLATPEKQGSNSPPAQAIITAEDDVISLNSNTLTMAVKTETREGCKIKKEAINNASLNPLMNVTTTMEGLEAEIVFYSFSEKQYNQPNFIMGEQYKMLKYPSAEKWIEKVYYA